MDDVFNKHPLLNQLVDRVNQVIAHQQVQHKNFEQLSERVTEWNSSGCDEDSCKDADALSDVARELSIG